MSIELEPAELSFRRPFTQEVIQTLTLRNINRQPVAFKVKTTAPKQYCVRPNSGRIEANETVEVQVILQAMKQDPPLEPKCKDKFLVQSTSITSEIDHDNVATIWQHAEKLAKEEIKERKIRVTWLPENAGMDGTNNSHAYEIGGGTVNDQAAFHSPVPEKNGSLPARSASLRAQEDYSTPSKSSAPRDSVNPFTNPDGVSGAANATAEALKAQLDAANEQIRQLRADSADGTLRQRTSAAVKDASDKAGSAAQQVGQQVAQVTKENQGVSVALAAGLCFLSFLLAYLFF